MDLDKEWEVLPEDGFLEINDDGGKNIFSRKHNTDGMFNMNYTYFVCPPPKPPQFVDPTTPSSHVVPKPVGTPAEPAETLQEKISQVRFFKKMNDQGEEFLGSDMKMDSPRSTNKAVVPQIDVGGELEAYEVEPFEGTKDVVSSPGVQENEGFNFWQWSLTGIGAICSFGVAAATTICIVFIENQQKHKRQQQNHKIRFQIYTHHDKRIKEVVQHASKLNEAISTVRGVPFNRAHITFGGYCDAF